MARKTKPSSKTPLARWNNLSRRSKILIGLVFVATVGAYGAYLVTSSLAFTPCNKRGLLGVGNAGTCVYIVQRTVKNFGSPLSPTGGYFKYGPKSDLNSRFVDGVYGSITKRQVENFQRWQGIGIDGVVGPATWGRLCSLPFTDISRTDRYNACGY